MNQRIKQEWLKRLRSGDYVQGKSQLRSNTNKYCCLGVLCEIYLEEKGVEWERKHPYKDEDDPDYFEYRVDDNEHYLPPNVMEWAELDSQEGWHNGLGWGKPSRASLAMMNDQGKTFEEIAQAIEEKL